MTLVFVPISSTWASPTCRCRSSVLVAGGLFKWTYVAVRQYAHFWQATRCNRCSRLIETYGYLWQLMAPMVSVISCYHYFHLVIYSDEEVDHSTAPTQNSVSEKCVFSPSKPSKKGFSVLFLVLVSFVVTCCDPADLASDGDRISPRSGMLPLTPWCDVLGRIP